MSFVTGASGFQTYPIRQWHPNMNRFKNRLFVGKFDVTELIPLLDTKLGPTPSAQVCTKFEYIDLSFQMVSYWTFPEFHRNSLKFLIAGILLKGWGFMCYLKTKVFILFWEGGF